MCICLLPVTVFRFKFAVTETSWAFEISQIYYINSKFLLLVSLQMASASGEGPSGLRIRPLVLASKIPRGRRRDSLGFRDCKY